MVVVIGRVQTSPEKRDELIRLGRTLAQASRGDAGCLGYRFYEDNEVENDFVFVEEWESVDALKAHFSTPHIAEFMHAVPAAVVAPPDVRFHVVERSAGLSDVNDL